MNIENIKEIYRLAIEELNNCPDEDECTDEENEIYDELANIKQIIGDNMEYLNNKEQELNEYFELNDENNKLLVKAINKAFKDGDEVFFNNYQSYDREDGTPSYYGIDKEEYDEIEDIEDLDTPGFDMEGCNDLVIHKINSDEYFYVLYSDNYEDRVYKDDLLRYLEEEN